VSVSFLILGLASSSPASIAAAVAPLQASHLDPISKYRRLGNRKPVEQEGVSRRSTPAWSPDGVAAENDEAILVPPPQAAEGSTPQTRVD